MKLAVIGSRVDIDDLPTRLLSYIPPHTTEIVSGGAEGIDQAAEQAAAMLSLPTRIFYPDYETYGKQAPLIRNDQIVDHADEIVAFWDGHSAGTMYTVRRCLQVGKVIRIVPLSELTANRH